MIKKIETKHFETTIKIEPKNKQKESSKIDYREIQNKIENKGKHIDKYA